MNHLRLHFHENRLHRHFHIRLHHVIVCESLSMYKYDSLETYAPVPYVAFVIDGNTKNDTTIATPRVSAFVRIELCIIVCI